jgi:dolichyl-phosphate beta-glucosyltransferase
MANPDQTGSRRDPYLSIVIPAYNEAASIVGTLGKVRDYLDRQAYGYEVIVSADGDDGTRERAREWAAGDARFSVIGSAERGGKGRGVRQGLARAAGRVVGFVDADYKTGIEEVERLLPHFDAGYDVVIGSRAMADTKIVRAQPLYRRLGSRAFGVIMHAVVGLPDVRDTQCGFKFFTARAAREIFGRQRIDGYMFDVEILALADQLGLRVKEVGVSWQDDGDSRYDPIFGTIRNARELLRIGYHRRLRPLRPIGEAVADVPTHTAAMATAD